MPEYGKQRDRERDIEGLFELARDILTCEEKSEALDAIVKRSLALLGGDRGFLVLRRGSALDYQVVRGWHPEDFEGDGEPISRSILNEVLQRPEPLLIKDAASDPRFLSKRSVKRLMIRSVLAAPLSSKGEAIGALYLESRSMQRFFNEEELALFQQILTLSSRTLEAFLQKALLEASTLEEIAAGYQHRGILTRDPGYLKILAKAMRVAHSQLPVLIQGESGVGKELFARAIHQESPRSKRPLITVNCGAIAPFLLESTLFGHLKGSFTGATQTQPGMLEEAHQGTLFLDEIGELPKELQAKLLRAVQFGEVQPLGSTKTQRFDVRFIAATNRDLVTEARAGRFREDLLYRLNAATLTIPPLRERPGDVLLLLHNFWKVLASRDGRTPPQAPKEIEDAFLSYPWPGNIRELENEANLLYTMTSPDLPLTPDLLSATLQPYLKKSTLPPTPPTKAPPEATTLQEQERAMIELHLKNTGGNKTHAAKSLGISREALRQMMKRHGIS